MTEELKPATIHEANVFLPGGLGPVRREVVLLGDHYAYVEALRAQPPSQGGEQCKWVRDEDEETYQTACGSHWHYTDGGYPGEHGQLYCHHCGKPIDDEAEDHE